MSDPRYTEDWFTAVLPTWRPIFEQLRDAQLKILEIGAFEGRSTRWLLETCPKATITVIDSFEADPMFPEVAWAGLRERFNRNIAPYRDRVRIWSERSDTVLPRFLAERQIFHFIYVDGSHWASDVLFDAVCAWRLLAHGGLMCFDDYTWDVAGISEHQHPRAAIDAFLRIYIGPEAIPDVPNRQVWVQKDAPI